MATRTWTGELETPANHRDVWRQVDLLRPGPTIVRVCAGADADVGLDAAIRRAAASHGFVVACASCAPPARGARILHRHVALVARSALACVQATDWVRLLAQVSPRSHLVFVWPSAWTTRATRCTPAGEAEKDDVRLRGLIEAQDFTAADAWLSALRAQAVLLGHPCRASTLRLWATLRRRQGRVEDATRVEARLRGARPPVRAAAARITSFQRRSEVVSMHVLDAVPDLLQIVGEADDELAALKGAAAWARARAGARRVAFIGGEAGRFVIAEAGAGGRIADADRLWTISTPDVDARTIGSETQVAAPVRYAGARVGGVLLSGTEEHGATLRESAPILAALCASALRARLDVLANTRTDSSLLPEMVGCSPALRAVRDAVARAASTPFPVLIEGESGTGKELVARALHRLSARRDRRFAGLNCAAIADELVEAELFGHTRGAFTGAVAPRTGLFEDAHGGTLFLDEVAELSPRAQAKLLRVLQEREVRRMGENMSRTVDVRIVAATNRALTDACVQGQFRHDLLFRLAVVRLRLPPLRERAEDVAPLALAFWRRAVADVEKRAVLGADALARLAAYRWPGNVRELQNVVAGLAVVAPLRGRVGARHVEQVLADAGATARMPPMSLERARVWCEHQTIAAALARHGGRRTSAARELGLTRQGLTKAMRRLHITEAQVEGVA